MSHLSAQDITGLVLAGGQGARMGGADKGLQTLAGLPLAQHALERLRPQVGTLAISAQRNLQRYGSFGVPVWPDASAEHAGPLAGMLAGLAQCSTPWLLTVPCDAPGFPTDLAARLAAAVVGDIDLVMASAPEAGSSTPRLQPVFCLLSVRLHDSLRQFMQQGGRKALHWTQAQRHALVQFEAAQAFANANTMQDLHALEATLASGHEFKIK